MRHLRSPLGILILSLLLPAVPAWALPNLKGCIAVDIAPDDADATYTVTVINDGDQPAGAAFYWDAWFNSFEQPTQQSSWALQVPAGLGAGQVYEASTTWSQVYPSSPLLVGDLRAWLFVDSIHAVGEADETDNWCGPVAYTVGDPDLPDIVITDFTVDVNEDVVTYSATLVNAGGADAPPFNLDVFKNQDVAPGAPPPFGDDVLGVPDGLAAGGEITVMFPPMALANGSYCSWLVADIEDAVAERDEGNNVAGPHCFEVAATMSLDRPDLVVVDFTSEVQDDLVFYTAWVKNAGTRATEAPFTVGLFVDEVLQPQTGAPPDTSFVVSTPLARGNTLPVYLYWTDLANGTFSSWVFADVGGDVPEIIEKNNTAGPLDVTVSLGGPDLAVDDFSWEWDPVGAVVYQVDVTNRGDADAGPFDLDLALDLAEAPTPENLNFTEVLTQRDEVGLAAGASRSYELRWETPTAGDHASWIAVDLYRESGDRLLGNNVQGPLDVPVSEASLELPDLRVEALAAEVDGVTLDLYVKVVNAGPRATGEFRVALFLDRTEAPAEGERGDLETLVPSLGPADADGTGDEVVWTPSYTALQDSQFSVWVRVDSDGQVAEADELNNHKGPVPAAVSVSSCPLDQQLDAACVCGVDVARVGEFCCEGGVVSTLRCQAATADWDEAEATPDADAGGGGGGCVATGRSGFPRSALLIPLLALALLTAGRSTRARGARPAPEVDLGKSREL
jgi:hypothetical protein